MWSVWTRGRNIGATRVGGGGSGGGEGNCGVSSTECAQCDVQVCAVDVGCSQKARQKRSNAPKGMRPLCITSRMTIWSGCMFGFVHSTSLCRSVPSIRQLHVPSHIGSRPRDGKFPYTNHVVGFFGYRVLSRVLRIIQWSARSCRCQCGSCEIFRIMCKSLYRPTGFSHVISVQSGRRYTDVRVSMTCFRQR